MRSNRRERWQRARLVRGCSGPSTFSRIASARRRAAAPRARLPVPFWGKSCLSGRLPPAISRACIAFAARWLPPAVLADHSSTAALWAAMVSGLDRKHWSSAGPIRKIFKDAFAGASLPYFNPHSFRKTLAQLGETVCRTPEQFKAWSQNIGHEKVLMTFSSYGEVAAQRQRDIIRELARPMEADPQVQEILKQLMRATQRAIAPTASNSSTASNAAARIEEQPKP
jgi:hypothetical protein